MDEKMINTLGQYVVHSGSATVLIDEVDDVVFCTKRAQAILARAKTIARQEKKLSFNNCLENQQLISSIALAKYQRKSNTVYLDDKAFSLPLRIDIAPISSTEEGNEATPVIIHFSTGDDKDLHLSKAFREHYSLTASEEQLADLLKQGLSISEIADKRNVKETTVRWTLANVFLKTKTNSQRELRQLARHFSDLDSVLC